MGQHRNVTDNVAVIIFHKNTSLQPHWQIIHIYKYILILSLIVTITSLQIKLTRLTQEIALLKNEKENKE